MTATEKFEIKPGPNNPVGLVYIALSKETYGIHGSPQASAISRQVSHGCVRLTNWDALDLARMVTKGETVTFVERNGRVATDQPSSAAKAQVSDTAMSRQIKR